MFYSLGCCLHTGSTVKIYSMCQNEIFKLTVTFNHKTYWWLFWCFLPWCTLFLGSFWTCQRRWRVVQSFIFLFTITLMQNYRYKVNHFWHSSISGFQYHQSVGLRLGTLGHQGWGERGEGVREEGERQG